MFRRKKGISREAAWDAWQPLPPHDPFVQRFGEEGEVIYNGVEAIDWDQRNIPGTPRSACERLLVVTSQRLLVVYKDEGDIAAIPYAEMSDITDRTMGMQGFVRPSGRNDEGMPWTMEWSMHRDVAPVVAKKMREFWAASRG